MARDGSLISPRSPLVAQTQGDAGAAGGEFGEESAGRKALVVGVGEAGEDGEAGELSRHVGENPYIVDKV